MNLNQSTLVISIVRCFFSKNLIDFDGANHVSLGLKGVNFCPDNLSCTAIDEFKSKYTRNKD